MNTGTTKTEKYITQERKVDNMMYTNLFNPNYKAEPYSREWSVYYQVQHCLKHVITLCKKNYTTCAKTDLYEFRGALQYMLFVGDIDGATRKLLYGITKQIVKKYNLY